MPEYNQTKFDSKSFNPVAFGRYVDTIPATRRTELLKSRALQESTDVKEAFTGKTGTCFATIPILGRIDGTPVNYDGNTDIVAQATTTFEQGMIVIGRAQAWTEKDFSDDITGGVQFMDNVAKQVAEYWDIQDQGLVLSVLKGVFSMSTGAKNQEFVRKHTLDITDKEGTDKDGNPLNQMGATTLNTVAQQACGDNKGSMTMVIMHSTPATNLENMRLLAYLKYTDKDGVERPLTLAAWNGRAVLIDDTMPCRDGYFDASSTTTGALKVVASGASTGEIALSDVTNYFGSKELAADDYVVPGTLYETYVLGEGAIKYADIGADVPQEMSRDPKTNGGQDTLYSRRRKVFAPKGISFTKKVMASLSPTDAELENGQNWTLVHNGETGSSAKYIDHKVIPIARILSRG